MSGAATKPPARLRAAIRAYDLDRSIEFYSGLLGLPIGSRWDHEGGGCSLDAGSGVIELVGKPPDMKMRGGWDFIPPTAKIDLILEVPDVDAWHARLTAAGATPEAEPADTSWGGRLFRVLDPDETPVVFLTLGKKP